MVDPSGAGSYLSGNLIYGGTSFIRNTIVGSYNPAQPDRLANEMTAYSTRHWYFDGSLTNLPTPKRFTSDEAQLTQISMPLITPAEADIPPTQGDTYNNSIFKERSVATSDWELQFFTVKNGVQQLNLDQLDDIEIWFKHVATDRNL